MNKPRYGVSKNCGLDAISGVNILPAPWKQSIHFIGYAVGVSYLRCQITNMGWGFANEHDNTMTGGGVQMETHILRRIIYDMPRVRVNTYFGHWR